MSTSSRQYVQQQPHTRDPYYPQTTTTSSTSPASARKPSKRPASSSVTTPSQLTPFQTGTGGTSPRGQRLPASPGGSSAVARPYSPTIPVASNSPSLVSPPRTSSYPYSQTAASPAGRTSLDTNTPNRGPSSPGYPRPSSPNTAPVYNQYGSLYGRETGVSRILDDRPTAATSAARELGSAGGRATPPKDAPTSGSARDTQARRSPAVLPREESRIINRMLITDPQVDIAREEARMAEARPGASGADLTPIRALGVVGSGGVPEVEYSGRSRHDHSRSEKSRKETKFGEYILGQTLGEGEFGKVKMGWKKTGGVQVAIKLIRRETLGSNPSRLPKIYREIAILRELQHPNIVRLHEMVETERHIGIIMEYASGGELFDYILNHRYLKDTAARRLFAQLVSGVGYLHKKGIVHRDLKLENLLLDRNKNIIITDFGFANTFNPLDELGDEVEYNLSNREYVKRMGLNALMADGHRRGDLMQTSCGSPCYAAPELVVSDSLYTGRKVDVWSCGVILYAMLAGYLPFDDDPANPEGDNINLLYRYITSTPLTFPEYVTPHARDLLRRILVPDPRKRADLFEVARHSWLSEYAHVVGFITSSTTTTNDIANTTVTAAEQYEVHDLARSASVREPPRSHQSSPGHPVQNREAEDQVTKKPAQRDTKRRTVQVEYVAPQSQTARGNPLRDSGPPPSATAPTSVRSKQASGTESKRRSVEIASKVMSAPLVDYQSPGLAPRSQPGVPPSTRSTREVPRSVSDSTALGMQSNAVSSGRPNTSGSLSGGVKLPSRGNSYGQPAAATVAPTNVQGRFSQPKGSKQQYVISAPIPQNETILGDSSAERPSTHQGPINHQTAPTDTPEDELQKGHKRSSTVGGVGEKIFGRSGSMFAGRPKSEQRPQKADRRYPPVSMPSNMPATNESRKSTESRRTSMGFSRKSSDVPSQERSSKRFSLLPSSWSRNSSSSAGKEKRHSDVTRKTTARPGSAQQTSRSRPVSRPTGMAFGRGLSRSPSQSTTDSTIGPMYDSGQDRRRPLVSQPVAAVQGTNISSQSEAASAYGSQIHTPTQRDFPQPPVQPYSQVQGQPSYTRPDSRASLTQQRQPQPSTSYTQAPPRTNNYEPYQNPMARAGNDKTAVLQGKNRKFADAYEQNKHGQLGGQHAGSSGSVKKVMDYFRRRGKARSGA